MSKYLGNAFSLNMLSIQNYALARFKRITAEDIPLDAVSAIGHADTAAVVSNILGREILAARVNVKLEMGDVLYVAQYSGPRLPEGATALPEGAEIDFLEVTLRDKICGGCHQCYQSHCEYSGM